MVATWGDTCPVQGRCTECGLDFLWRDLLNPVYQRQARFVEHARRGLLRSGLRTLLASWLPRRFWRELQMHHVLALRRLCFMHVWTIVFSLACVGGVVLWEVLARVSWSWGSPSQVALFQIEAFFSMAPTREPYWSYVPSMGDVAMSCGVWLATFALIPGSLVLLPQTRKRAKLHQGHIARLGLYALGLIPLLLVVRLIVHMEIIENASSLASRYIVFYRISMMVVTLGVQACIIWWFWRCALRHYAKIPHPEGVATAAMAIALLLGLALAMATGQIVLA